ncbi:hypothetical protein SAMN05444392_10673 [Seinonella peptonophila]|uniref:Uncharacterized protein n=1 Tax=Seinonella peptonophila TaxID=112248 RepID=A0A1M4Y6A8_9BACL|nr:hypothetical protein [Seinonella peptonophila]SHF01344.1 hypothetical protein SAMN05444392_10673 [Seinonella peptonophila]
MQLGYYIYNDQLSQPFIWNPIYQQTVSHPILDKTFTFYHSNDIASNPFLKKASRRLDRFFTSLQSDSLSSNGSCFLEEIHGGKQLNRTVYSHMKIDEHEYYVFTQGIKDLPSSINQFSRIHIYSGICLFGAQTIYGTTANNQKVSVLTKRLNDLTSPITDFWLDDNPSFYEIESIVRLSHCISDFVSTLPASIPYSITLDEPRLQYVLYLLDLLERQLISYPLLEQWMNYVNRRHQAVLTSYKEAILALLKKKNLKHVISINDANGLSPIDQLITEGIVSRKMPDLAKLIAELSSNDECWALLCNISPPQTYQELSYLSYVRNFLQQCLKQADEPAELLFQIDNPMERKIYRYAKNYVKKINQTSDHQYQCHAAALFPHEQIFLATGPAELYYHQWDQQSVRNVQQDFSILEKLYSSTHQSLIMKNFQDASVVS